MLAHSGHVQAQIFSRSRLYFCNLIKLCTKHWTRCCFIVIALSFDQGQEYTEVCLLRLFEEFHRVRYRETFCWLPRIPLKGGSKTNEGVAKFFTRGSEPGNPRLSTPSIRLLLHPLVITDPLNLSYKALHYTVGQWSTN